MKYRFGIIFDFYPYLKRNDPGNIFVNVDHRLFLTEIVKFITEDSGEVRSLSERGSDIEGLLNTLVEEGVLSYHVVFRRQEPYIDICSVLLDICEELVGVFLDAGFFNYCSSYSNDKPKVLHVSRDNYAIVTGPKTR